MLDCLNFLDQWNDKDVEQCSPCLFVLVFSYFHSPPDRVIMCIFTFTSFKQPLPKIIHSLLTTFKDPLPPEVTWQIPNGISIHQRLVVQSLQYLHRIDPFPTNKIYKMQCSGWFWSNSNFIKASCNWLQFAKIDMTYGSFILINTLQVKNEISTHTKPMNKRRNRFNLGIPGALDLSRMMKPIPPMEKRKLDASPSMMYCPLTRYGINATYNHWQDNSRIKIKDSWIPWPGGLIRASWKYTVIVLTHNNLEY